MALFVRRTLTPDALLTETDGRSCCVGLRQLSCMLNFELKYCSGSRLTHLWVLQQLNGESTDGLIHCKTDQTAFPEMSVIFGVVLYPELQVNPDHM